MPFIAAQFYPRVYTLVPAGLAVGFGGGPLWCAKCTYLTVVAEAFSTLLHGEIKQEVLVVRFFGLFFIFYQMAQVWGNLISSSGNLYNISPFLLNNFRTQFFPVVLEVIQQLKLFQTLLQLFRKIMLATMCPNYVVLNFVPVLMRQKIQI